VYGYYTHFAEIMSNVSPEVSSDGIHEHFAGAGILGSDCQTGFAAGLYRFLTSSRICRIFINKFVQLCFLKCDIAGSQTWYLRHAN
jgi:hypothetical protein